MRAAWLPRLDSWMARWLGSLVVDAKGIVYTGHLSKRSIWMEGSSVSEKGCHKKDRISCSWTLISSLPPCKHSITRLHDLNSLWKLGILSIKVQYCYKNQFDQFLQGVQTSISLQACSISYSSSSTHGGHWRLSYTHAQARLDCRCPSPAETFYTVEGNIGELLWRVFQSFQILPDCSQQQVVIENYICRRKPLATCCSLSSSKILPLLISKRMRKKDCD